MTIQTQFITGTNWWGAGEGIYISSIPEKPTASPGGIHDIFFKDVTVVSESLAFISNRD